DPVVVDVGDEEPATRLVVGHVGGDEEGRARRRRGTKEGVDREVDEAGDEIAPAKDHVGAVIAAHRERRGSARHREPHRRCADERRRNSANRTPPRQLEHFFNVTSKTLFAPANGEGYFTSTK